MRIGFFLPGLHRVRRGAEIAFESIAQELGKIENVEVTLFGSGYPKNNTSYSFVHVGNIEREKFERWPSIKPLLRNERIYEELTFIPGLAQKYNPHNFDITIACSYPYINWFLMSRGGKKRPSHVFVTQNGDNPIRLNNYEWRFFSCDAVVCTNLEYLNSAKRKWPCKVITNGVDLKRFFPGQQDRDKFDLPRNVPLALIVSALVPSKRILQGIRAAAQIDGLHLVVCGDGPEREKVKALGAELMPGRFFYKKLSYEEMPDIYRAADIFIHMSLDEPFGNVYIEALATGLPVVAHDREVSRWILEDTAVLVDTTETSDVEYGILQALKMTSHSDILKRRSLVERRYSWEKIGKDYYEFLSEIINRNTSTSN
ncbi:MAG: hypothetical protein OHK0037_21330 [Elainellaceae cyanobacterium]